MSIEFSADEIFEMAEQIERNGSGFYRQAASRAAKSPVSEIFLRLAAQEDEHEKTFAQMRSELNPVERRANPLDPDHENTAYLRAWADGHVFDVRRNLAGILTGKENVEDVVQLAIGMEKDSIVFYLGMKDAVPPRLGRNQIDRIIREEMGHLSSLTRYLESLRHQLT